MRPRDWLALALAAAAYFFGVIGLACVIAFIVAVLSAH